MLKNQKIATYSSKNLVGGVVEVDYAFLGEGGETEGMVLAIRQDTFGEKYRSVVVHLDVDHAESLRDVLNTFLAERAEKDAAAAAAAAAQTVKRVVGRVYYGTADPEGSVWYEALEMGDGTFEVHGNYVEVEGEKPYVNRLEEGLRTAGEAMDAAARWAGVR